jgi:hypothetical protein
MKQRNKPGMVTFLQLLAMCEVFVIVFSFALEHVAHHVPLYIYALVSTAVVLSTRFSTTPARTF